MKKLKCIGEITRKSKKHRFYMLKSADQEFSLKIPFSQIPDDCHFIIGDVIEFEVSRENETIQFYKLIRKLSNKLLDELKLAYTNQQTLQGFAFARNRKGYYISYNGFKCFLPLNEMVFKRSPHSESIDLLKSNCDFLVKSIIAGNVILTRVEIDRKNKLTEIQNEIDSIYQGYSFKGTINKILDFGLFVTLKNSNGLIHLSEILGVDSKTAGKIKTDFYKLAKTVFNIGEKLQVTVKEVNGQKFSLEWDKDDDNNNLIRDKIKTILDNDDQFVKIRDLVKQQDK